MIGTRGQKLKPENKDQLVAILTYHVVPGKVLSTDLQDKMTPGTVNGATVHVNVSKKGVKIN